MLLGTYCLLFGKRILLCVRVKDYTFFIFLFVFMCIAPLTDSVRGQSFSNSNRSVKQFTISSDTVVLDTLSLVWGSVSVNGIEENDYTIDHLNGHLIVQNPEYQGKTITVFFRTYPQKLNKETINKSTSIIEKRLYEPVNPFSVIEPISPMEALFNNSHLNTSGSISRGISIGNSQDMVVNSNLNLQISGMLDENIEILASITDQNIPIQPEGNTAQLKEFDKIFIQLKYKKLYILPEDYLEDIKSITTIQAGDIEPKSSENSYFMRFTRQGQGLNMTHIKYKADSIHKNSLWDPDPSTWNAPPPLKVGFSAAMAKGTFHRQAITAIEGVQGPYPLRGINGETYIMVLAGSEKVYINSVLLKRGEDADYVINYNSGEITFTSRQMITRDKRILVEFEYSDRTYSRSILHLNTEINKKKTAFRFNFYNEQDMKNQPNQLDLSEEQKLFLSSIGNNIDNAYMLNMDSVVFQSNEVLYKMIDTLVNGVRYDSVFVYSTNKDSACYRLGFSVVGQGKGDYILTQNTVNGRVYVWVAPINGVSQGNYAPVQLLVTPKRTQMYTMAMDYLPFKNTFFSVEGALSNNDQNTFSRIDDQRNVGFGLKVIADNTKFIHSRMRTWRMNVRGFYEVKNANFRAIEDYREISFARDYNCTDSLRYSTEHFGNISLFFNEKDKKKIGLTSNIYFIPKYNYKAINNHIFTDFNIDDYIIKFETKILNNRQFDYKTLFVQNNETFSKTFKYIEVGVANELELNLYKSILTDSVLPQSFAFNEASFFINNGSALSSSYKYGIRYSNRLEANAQAAPPIPPEGGVLSTNAMAHIVTSHFDFIKYIDHPLRFNISYRNLKIHDSIGENTLLSSLDYQGRFWKGAIQIGTFYEVGSGMEQKSEYAYLRVAEGQGTYQWIDYNGNGIEELDEFEIAVYKDNANYIRIWLPSNDYIKTYNNQLTQSLILRPMTVWRNTKGVKKFIARFSNATTYKTQLKNTLSSINGIINPFYRNIGDTSLVNTSNIFRNALSFNQTSSLWGLDAIYNNARNKNLNVNGFESNAILSWIFSGRYTIKKMFTLKSEYQNGWITKSSEFMQNRNSQIYYNSIEGSVSYQHKTSIKLTALHKYTQKINKQGDEQSYNNNTSLEFNYTMPQKGNIMVKMSYFYIMFRGAASSPVAYEMLEALSPGSNGIANVVYQTTLWQNLQLNLSYEGRIGESYKMKHLGSVELRAYF